VVWTSGEIDPSRSFSGQNDRDVPLDSTKYPGTILHRISLCGPLRIVLWRGLILVETDSPILIAACV
jgi:hypothetical protein